MLAAGCGCRLSKALCQVRYCGAQVSLGTMTPQHDGLRVTMWGLSEPGNDADTSHVPGTVSWTRRWRATGAASTALAVIRVAYPDRLTFPLIALRGDPATASPSVFMIPLTSLVSPLASPNFAIIFLELSLTCPALITRISEGKRTHGRSPCGLPV